MSMLIDVDVPRVYNHNLKSPSSVLYLMYIVSTVRRMFWIEYETRYIRHNSFLYLENCSREQIEKGNKLMYMPTV